MNRHQRRYARLVAAGLCVQCAKVPPLVGRVKCESCGKTAADACRKVKREKLETRKIDKMLTSLDHRSIDYIASN